MSFNGKARWSPVPQVRRSSYGFTPESRVGSPTMGLPTHGGGGSGASSMPRIRRPRKILYLIVVFGALYWYGLRHGLGVERGNSVRPAPKLVPRPPIGGALGVGKGAAAGGGIWDNTLNGLGLKKEKVPKKPIGHVTLKDKGMVEVRDTSGSAEHPIYDLMQQARTNFDSLIARQSRTLPQAVAEYEKRYHVRPPAGFEKWWEFVVENDVKIVDDYDRLMTDIVPFLALPQPTFLERHTKLQTQAHSAVFNITPRSITMSGDRAEAGRPKGMGKLLDGFRHYLPEGFDTQVIVSDHDLGSQVLGDDQRRRAMELAAKGEVFAMDELKKLQDLKRTPIKGWFSACDLDSPANVHPGAELDTSEIGPHAFVQDPLPMMSFCMNPALKRLHGSLGVDYPGRSPSELRPLLVLSKFANNAEIVVTPLEAYHNFSDKPDIDEISWEDKSNTRLFWRGSSTGGMVKDNPENGIWKNSHRMRLHLLMNGAKGKEDEQKAHKKNVMMPDGEGGYEIKEMDMKALNDAYTDVALAGKPVQCGNTGLCEHIADNIQFKPWVTPKEGALYKYAFDVDGNGWSSRLHRLLSSGSMIVKMSIFPEWYQGWLTPWLHYVPVQATYDDVYDVMAFFAGPIGPDGKVDASKGHDDLARQIGEAGQEFARDFWKWETMQAYMFRLILEYRRLMAEDRNAMSYTP